jgi:hypothetical protein
VKIPSEILALFDQESEGLSHGSICLTLFLRDRHPRFTLVKELSIIPTDEQSADPLPGTIGRKEKSSSVAPALRKGGGK